MSNNDYLSKEEQFKETLNIKEIIRIKDLELRNIRVKYWHLLHQTFLDEHRIPDEMLAKEVDKIKDEEKKELDAYKQRNNYEQARSLRPLASTPGDHEYCVNKMNKM